jgi:hypothetical protein
MINGGILAREGIKEPECLMFLRRRAFIFA